MTGPLRTTLTLKQEADAPHDYLRYQSPVVVPVAGSERTATDPEIQIVSMTA